MPTKLITSAIIAKETLLNFENNLTLGNDIDWQYNSKFSKNDPIGSTYTLRRPISPDVVENNMSWAAAQAAGKTSVTANRVVLAVDSTLSSYFALSEADLALRIDKFAKGIVSTTSTKLAATLDSFIARSIVNSIVPTVDPASGLAEGPDITPYDAAGRVVNSAGYAIGSYAVPMTPDLIMHAKKILMDRGCPDDGDIYGALTTTAQSQLVLAQAGLFNTLMLVDKTYRKGKIGEFADIMFSCTQSLARHVNGTLPKIVVSSGSVASGWKETATLTVASATGAVPGDMFQFVGSYIVNPLNKQDTDVPFQVQVLSVTDATHIVVAPAPIHDGQYKNCSTSVNTLTAQLTGSFLPGAVVNDAAGTASVSLAGTESLIWHKSAIAAASIELVLPTKEEMAETITDEDDSKFKIRFVRQWDGIGVSNAFNGGPGNINRFDVMYGIKVTNTDWIVRLRSGGYGKVTA